MNEATKVSTQNFKDLLVWRKGMILARMIYQVTREFPGDERFGLVVQMRRAAVSIPSNIAEGQAGLSLVTRHLSLVTMLNDLPHPSVLVPICLELGELP